MQIELIAVRTAWSLSAITSASGPMRLLEAGLIERLEEVADVHLSDIGSPGAITGTIAAEFSLAAEIARSVRRSIEAKRLPVVLSGSCLSGLGGLAGTIGENRGVIWLDCHGDFNTPETSTSGLLDGMVTAMLVGKCWHAMAAGVDGFGPIPEDALLLVGARDFDDGEIELLRRSSLQRMSSDDANGSPRNDLDRLATRCDAIYLHVDLDVLDPSVGMANRFAKPGGLSSKGFRSFMSAAGGICPISAVTFASWDPDAEPDGEISSTATSGLCELVRTMERGTD